MSGQKQNLGFFACNLALTEWGQRVPKPLFFDGVTDSCCSKKGKIMSRTKTLKIGNAGGFWGDDPFALKRQVERGHLDYISIDFLAEITMSIMQKQYSSDPTKGYAYDIVSMLKEVLPQLLKNKTKLITNAGGINPKSCAKAIQDMAQSLGLNPKIAVVYGDNILSEIDELEKKGAQFVNMETGEDFSSVKNQLEAANVYFGAMPVVEALRKWNPDIIITGRVTDTGITLAPMIYEFNWSERDWNKLASGIIAGHLIECGTQVSGGNFSDWEKVPTYDEIGFPFVEMSEDGSFVITKHENTGGLVSIDTVREQLFYEMGDPHSYITPDVVADFSTVQLKALETNKVHVSGIKGYEPTPFYKVSMAYKDGFKCSGCILISGPHARKKAETFAKIFWKRCKVSSFVESSTDYLGWNACHRSLGHQDEASEVLLRLNVRSRSEGDLKTFRKLISALILSGPPGVTVLSDGIGKIHSVVSYWPALMPKNLVHARIASNGEELIFSEQVIGNYKASPSSDQLAKFADKTLEETFDYKDVEKGEWVYFEQICLARSGDKGDTVNIGVIARNAQAYEFLKNHLTAQRIKNLFQEFCAGQVTRFRLDALQGLNFLLEQSLGGGGSRSLRADAQGKTFSQALLRQKIFVPFSVLKS